MCIIENRKGVTKMDKVYIFGHRKPDTDSVCAAISLSYLKNKLGVHAIPAILSNINNETKYALDFFNVKEPIFLNDVKLKIKDIQFKRNYFISKKDPIILGYEKMKQENLSKIPVIDEKGTFIGVLGMKDIANDQIEGDINNLNSSYQNLLTTLHGQEILRFDEEIKGNILVASYKSTTFIDTVSLNSQDILIVGDRHSIIEYAVKSKVKCIILTGDSNIKEEHLQIAKQNKVNIIKTPYLTFKVSKIINLCNYISTITTNSRVLCIDINDNVTDFIDIANKTKYSYYPVIDKHQKCLGMVRLSDTSEKKKKKVILVDHNSIAQTVEGIDEADILEIIDHHNIGTIGTATPINFRNMPVGSTNTIIYQMYKENNIEISKEIAGLMASGIISDTILLKSPTTTDLDRTALEELSKIAGINKEEYGLNLIKASASLKGKTKEEIIYQDFKVYPIKNSKMGIGQISTTNPEEILNEKEEYIQLLEKIAENNDYVLLTLLVCDVLNNGSYILYNKKAETILKNSFNKENLQEGMFLDKIVSRKLQVVPAIMENANN